MRQTLWKTTVKKKVKGELQNKKEKMKGDEMPIKVKYTIVEVTNSTQKAPNDLENYTHKNKLRRFGFKEDDAETVPDYLAIDLFWEKVQVDVTEKEIGIVHRAGRYRSEGHHDPEKPRPILIKLFSDKIK